MATVRLILYANRPPQNEVACNDIAGATLLDAATDAVMRGLETSLDFHVVEAEGEPVRLYWVGRRAQKVSRTEARALLAAKGL